MNTKTPASKLLEKKFGSLTFGKLIEAYRLAAGLSQTAFAKKLKISQASLCDLEKGRKIPSAERAAKVAKILKEPENYWIQIALQDQLRQSGLDFVVSVA